jgi:hypothetical protein
VVVFPLLCSAVYVFPLHCKRVGGCGGRISGQLQVNWMVLWAYLRYIPTEWEGAVVVFPENCTRLGSIGNGGGGGGLLPGFYPNFQPCSVFTYCLN